MSEDIKFYLAVAVVYSFFAFFVLPAIMVNRVGQPYIERLKNSFGLQGLFLALALIVWAFSWVLK